MGDSFVHASSGSGGGGSGSASVLSGNWPLNFTSSTNTQNNDTIVGGVPNGALMTFNVKNQNAVTYAWSGGSTISGYFGGPFVNPPPNTMSLGANVPYNQDTFSFYVPASEPNQPTNYTVTVNITTMQNVQGTAVITFTAYPPAVASLTSGTTGKPQFWVAGGIANMYLSQINPASLENLSPNAMGIQILADTTASDEFGGNFMIIQLVDVSRAFSYADRSNWSYTNIGSGLNLDDGSSNGAFVGYKVYMNNDNNGPHQGNVNNQAAYGWTMNFPGVDAIQRQMLDNPGYNLSMTTEPGGIASNLSTMSVLNETYTTYLMYSPPQNIQGIWVALSKATWNWSESAATPWTNATGVSGPAPSFSTAVGRGPNGPVLSHRSPQRKVSGNIDLLVYIYIQQFISIDRR